MKKALGLVLVIFLLVQQGGLAMAFDGQKSVDKFSRGVANLSTGWVEFPRSLYEEGKAAEAQSPVLGIFKGYATGILKGTTKALIRTSIGAFEILSAPHGLGRDYQPLIFPELPWNAPEEQGSWT